MLLGTAAVVLLSRLPDDVVPSDTTTISGGSSAPQPSDIDISDLSTRINEQRASNGLTLLALNPVLNTSAGAKCQDMVINNYWAHVSPSGRQPWSFLTVPYIDAGENLAEGLNSASVVVAGWMASPEHRANILSPLYRQEGFAVCQYNSSDTYANQLVVVEQLTN